MAGKLGLEEQKVVGRENPAFAKLLDILQNSLLQDGKPRETSSRLKQVYLCTYFICNDYALMIICEFQC